MARMESRTLDGTVLTLPSYWLILRDAQQPCYRARVSLPSFSLIQALRELEYAGARVAGLEEELVNAPVGTVEQGKAKGGMRWRIRKAGPTLFDVEIGTQQFRFGP